MFSAHKKNPALKARNPPIAENESWGYTEVNSKFVFWL